MTGYFDNNGGHDGVGFASLLGLLFIGLKLGGAIDWPWLWVLSPLWLPLALVAVILAVVVAGAAWRK